MLTGAELRASRRRRLPRCIRGDRVLTPYALGSAMGLALLHNCGAAPMNSLVKGSGAGLLGYGRGREALSDSYETHMTLPGGSVAIITNVRLLMVASEAFAGLVAEAEAGHVSSVSAQHMMQASLCARWPYSQSRATVVRVGLAGLVTDTCEVCLASPSA